MKPHLLLLFVFGVRAVAWGQTADTPASAAPAAASADPFLKGKAVPVAKDSVPNPPPAVVVPPHGGIRLVLETYSLDMSDFDALLTEKLDSVALLKRVQQLVAEKKAVLNLVQSLVTQTGNKAMIESLDMVSYGTAYEKAGPVIPTAHEMRGCGERLEVDPVMGPDGKEISLNLSVENCRLVKWTDNRAGLVKAGQINPLFAISSRMTNVVMTAGSPYFVGTLSEPAGSGVAEADASGRVRLLFMRGDLALLPQPAKPEPAAFPPSRMVSAAFRFYSLERAEASRLLVAQVDGDALHQTVRALTKSGSAKLERLIYDTCGNGSRSKVDESAPYLYGTELGPELAFVKDVKDPANLVPRYTRFEGRPLGWEVEWECVLSPDQQALHMNLSLEHSEFRGTIAGHPLLESLPEQPVFGQRKIVMSVALPVGHSAFVGTFNPPGASGVNGRLDDGKTWLLFIDVIP